MQAQAKRVALITGANRGLGKETARQLAAAGYRVIVTARQRAAAEAAAAELKSGGADATAIVLDVTDPSTITAAAQAIAKSHGRVDALINNAGITGGGFETPIAKIDSAAILQTFTTNTLGPLRVTQAFLPLLAKSDAARIVNVSSGMGQLSDMATGAPNYRISKTALNAVTKLFANELKDSGTKVNAVCPGWVRTEMGGPGAQRSVEEGAKGIVWAAMLTADGPTGGFFRDGNSLPW